MTALTEIFKSIVHDGIDSKAKIESKYSSFKTDQNHNDRQEKSEKSKN